MINFLAGLLGGKTWLAWIIVAGVGLAGVGGVYAYVDHGGYSRAQAEDKIKFDAFVADLNKKRFAEIDRQAMANDAAKAAEQAAIADLEKQRDAAEALAAELAIEAANDPNANRLGIDADAVNRLNRIQ